MSLGVDAKEPPLWQGTSMDPAAQPRGASIDLSDDTASTVPFNVRTVIHLEGLSGAASSNTQPAAVPNSSGGQLSQERQKRKAAEAQIEVSNKALKQLEAQEASSSQRIEQLQTKAAASVRQIEQLQAQLALAQRAAETEVKHREEAVKREEEASAGASSSSSSSSSSSGGGGGGGGGASSDVTFELRRLALDQYKLMLRDTRLAGKTSALPWRLKLHRNGVGDVPTRLCDDVLRYMESAKRTELWRPTVVVFVGLAGPEEGVDQGGLTAEMHSCFWRDMLGAQSPLFERGLPRHGASPTKLRATGRMLCKSLLDDHPIGGGLARVVLHYLIEQHEPRVFGSVATALKALAEHEGEHCESLAARWSAMLSSGSKGTAAAVVEAGVYLSNFDEGVEEEEDHEVHAGNLEAAVLAGCRYRLLTQRRAELNALRDGFVGHIDLSVQLAPLTEDELALTIQGRVDFSADDLIGCFAWPAAPATADLNADEDTGEAAVHAALVEASGHLREWLSTACSEEQRLSLLQWATGYIALPLGGLKPDDRIKLIPKYGAGADHLPEIHTCSHELELPPYKSLEQLQSKLLKALEHRMEGFHTE